MTEIRSFQPTCVYRLIVFDRSGAPGAWLDYGCPDDEAARRQVPCALPYGGELRRGNLVVARFGSFGADRDGPERGSIQNLERIFRPSLGRASA